jgi:filamentous hemagglutinin family protein
MMAIPQAVNLALFPRQWDYIRCLTVSAACVGFVLSSGRVNAQLPIAGDGNAVINTNVQTLDNLNFTINQGNQQGGNLFHSFSQFSVPLNGSATFVHNPDVTTIFARVTGGRLSQIDGLIQTQVTIGSSTANLFLLNPAGVIFGSGARLNVGGSFVGTSASEVRFADGQSFAVNNPVPLLTVSVPIGLQMGAGAGSIQVQGNGHGVTGRTRALIATPLAGAGASDGIMIGSDHTLALVGNGINVKGGVINSPQGNVQLNSVAAGFVALQPITQGWQLTPSKDSQLSDINLSQNSIVDLSGPGGSQFNLHAQNLILQDGSLILMQNQGGRDSGKITLNASDRIQFSGSDATGTIFSGIHRQQLGSGQGGNVEIQSRNLDLLNGGAIVGKTFTGANNGHVLLNVSGQLTVRDFSPIIRENVSEIINYTFSDGQTGDMTINVGKLVILNAGLVGLGTFAAGSTNDLTVTAADSIYVSGEEPTSTQFSSLFAISLNRGDAGNLFITTPKLNIESGGRIGVSTFNTGNAGNLVVNASDSVRVAGQSPSLKAASPSLLSSSGSTLPPRLAALYGITRPVSGNAGSVIVNTNNLVVEDGGLVTARNQGSGDAGKLMINANQIRLFSGGGVNASTNTGNGGNVEIDANLVLMRDRGNITAEAKGGGNGGTLLLTSPVILGLNNSDIIANAQLGNGGRIAIMTDALFGLTFRPARTPDSDITASSDFGVSGSVFISNPEVSPNAGVIELSMTLVDPNQKVAAACDATSDSQFILSGRGGLPVTPDRLSNEIIWQDLRPLRDRVSHTVMIPSSSINQLSIAPTTILSSAMPRLCDALKSQED